MNQEVMQSFTTTVKRIILSRNTDMEEFKLALHSGNAVEGLSLLNQTGTLYRKIRTVITSPPYWPNMRRYGLHKSNEIGQEETSEDFIDNLVDVFRELRPLLTEDGSVWIVIDDGVKDGQKLNIPFRLVEKLKDCGYYYRDLVIWQKFNPPQGSLNGRLWPTYEYILFLSKGKQKPFFETTRLKMKRKAYDPILTNAIYTYHNMPRAAVPADPYEKSEYINMIDQESLLEGVFVSRRDYLIRHQINFEDFQVNPVDPSPYLIEKYERIIKSADKEHYPTTAEISAAFGFDPEKYCPVCYQKYKRHVSRNNNFQQSAKASIFALCMAKGKSFTNLWKLSIGGIVKGRTHEATFPFSLLYRIIKFTTNVNDFILDPFCGRGTTGMMAYSMNRNFVGIDLYKNNIDRTRNNIEDLTNKKYNIEFYDHEIA